jgi:hypothetical protein
MEILPRDRRVSQTICRSLAMADLIYLTVGLSFFAFVGLYAYACDRL